MSVDPGEGPASEVNPFIGTVNAASSAAVLNGTGGATFPGAALPFDLVQFSPDTPFTRPHSYHYDDTEILGFSATHLNGAGCSALRDAPLFPSVEPPTPGRTQSGTHRRRRSQRQRERSVPGVRHLRAPRRPSWNRDIVRQGEGALANLDAENPGWDFDAAHQAAVDAWNRYLGRVEVEGGSPADRTSF